MKLFLVAAAAAMALATAAQAHDYTAKVEAKVAQVNARIRKGPMRDNWTSLAQYRTPTWFRDAKFGIFIHWGVYSVPAFGNEWYSRNMYVKGNPAYTYHRAVYGPQSKFGYKDFIPLFKAEKFDPNKWIELFKQAGARYVVPVAEHCDGFPMYNSDFTDWDAAKMGPHRDVVGELAKAARAHGLYFGVSSHRAEHWWWYHAGRTFDSDVNDPRYAGLYGPAEPRTLPADPPGTEPDPSHLENWLPPNKAFRDDWLARTSELVDKYHPDLIYLDWWTSAPALQPELKKLAAYYYDQSQARGQGPVLTYKGLNFAEHTAVFDVERGKLDGLRLTPWQTDTSVSVNSWGYVKDDHYRSPKWLIDTLVDVVSKNGNLLLNVGPRSDGTIPEQVQQVLLAMGAWLKVNGEAIYGTRPWKYFGEGPTTNEAGQKQEKTEKSYTPEDIRFTRKGNVLYAIGLQPPEDGRVLVKTLYTGTPYLHGPLTSVELVGSESPVTWRQTPRGLEVQLPPFPHGALPYVLRIPLPPAAEGFSPR